MYDAHIHIALDGVDWRAALARHAQQLDEQAVRDVLATYAQAEFTYLRDGGDKCGASLLTARLAPEFDIEYASPAFAIYKRGGYGAFLGRPFDTLDEFKALVDEALEQGATFVKVMLSGILDFDAYGVVTEGGADASTVTQMVRYVHEQGAHVMAHVNGAVAIREALDAGIDSIEHGFYMDAPACRELAQSQTVWVPTFAPIAAQLQLAEQQGNAQRVAVLQRVLDGHVAMVARAHEAGACIALGTDAGSGSVLHVEAAAVERDMLVRALGDANAASDAIERGGNRLRELFPGA